MFLSGKLTLCNIDASVSSLLCMNHLKKLSISTLIPKFHKIKIRPIAKL